MRELIHGMSEDKAIVVSTHILEEVEAVCSRAVIIAKGRIVADDTPEGLLKKAPDHNAVIIRAADLVAVRAALSGVDGVDGIEDLDQARISVRPSRMRRWSMRSVPRFARRAFRSTKFV